VTVILALTSAVVFGAGDFCGGAASRRGDSQRVLLVSLPAGLVVMLAVAEAYGGPVHAPAITWGAASGLAGGAGLIVFYRALAVGPMSVVAPVSGMTAALVPAVAGVLRGDRLGAAAITGMVLCLVAICLVSIEKAGPARSRMTSGPVLAALSGTGFGAFFVLIRLGDDHTLWPLIASKAAGLSVVVVVAVAVRRGPLPLLRNRPAMAIALAAGVLDVLGNGLYVLAARTGMLSVAGVLSSLYPASTVLLARLVYGERLRPIQCVGLAVAVAGVGLVGAG
jgi:drug/metabolite transporter (DMT)-like permease